MPAANMRCPGSAVARLLVLATWVLLPATASAQDGAAKPSSSPTDPSSAIEKTESPRIDVVQEATSDKSAQKAAIARLPLKKLSPQDRKRVEKVLDSLSLYRRLASLRFQVEPDVYRFFLAHPDVAVSIWRVMEISQLKMWQTGPHEFEADDGEGTLGILTLLHREGGERLVLGRGEYKTSLLAEPIEATTLLHLHSRFVTGEDGTPQVVHHADLYISFPSRTVETAAKIVSPISNLIIDRNFREISLFLRLMSLAMVKRPGWVEYLSTRLEGVLPVRKRQLLKLAARVYVSARKRQLQQEANNEEITLQDVMGSLRKASREAETNRPETDSRPDGRPKLLPRRLQEQRE